MIAVAAFFSLLTFLVQNVVKQNYKTVNIEAFSFVPHFSIVACIVLKDTILLLTCIPILNFPDQVINQLFFCQNLLREITTQLQSQRNEHFFLFVSTAPDPRMTTPCQMCCLWLLVS